MTNQTSVSPESPCPAIAGQEAHSCPTPPTGIDVELDLLLIPQAHQHDLQFFGVSLACGHPLLDRVHLPRFIQRGDNLCFCNHRPFLTYHSIDRLACREPEDRRNPRTILSQASKS